MKLNKVLLRTTCCALRRKAWRYALLAPEALAKMSEIEEFLDKLKQKGYSSPAGVHWSRLHKVILKYADNPSNEKLSNPLILGGAIASHAAKHERLNEQLKWAEKHGCLNEALTYLGTLSDNKWNISNGSDWNEEHPWVTEGFD